MIDFINILQNSFGYSLAIIASKILDGCEKCNEEKKPKLFRKKIQRVKVRFQMILKKLYGIL